MSQGSLYPKIRFLGQKCALYRDGQTNRQIHIQTERVNTEDILSGFQELSLQPIIKDQSNNLNNNKKFTFRNCEVVIIWWWQAICSEVEPRAWVWPVLNVGGKFSINLHGFGRRLTSTVVAANNASINIYVCKRWCWSFPPTHSFNCVKKIINIIQMQYGGLFPFRKDLYGYFCYKL